MSIPAASGLTIPIMGFVSIIAPFKRVYTMQCAKSVNSNILLNGIILRFRQ